MSVSDCSDDREICQGEKNIKHPRPMESIFHEDGSYCGSGTMTAEFIQSHQLKGNRKSFGSNKTTHTANSIYSSKMTLPMTTSQMIKKSYADLLNAQVFIPAKNTTFKPILDGYDRPDGLHSWVVLLASVYLVMVGLIPIASVGVMYVVLDELYGKPQIVSWMCSIQASLLGIAGPVAAIICQKLGARITCLIGTIGITVCLVVTANLDSLPATFAIFGVLIGFLTALINLPAVTFPNRYFAKRKILAMSIATALGGGPAFIVFPYLIRVVEAHYGWRASLYFLAACSAQGVVASMLLREPKFNPEDEGSSKNDENMRDREEDFSSRCTLTNCRNGIETSCKSIESNGSNDRLNDCEHLSRENKETELSFGNSRRGDEQNGQQCLETVVKNKLWASNQLGMEKSSKSNTAETAKEMASSWRNDDEKMLVDQSSFWSTSCINAQETGQSKKSSCCAPSIIKLVIIVVCASCWGWSAGTFEVLFNDYALRTGQSEENILTMYLLMGAGSIIFRVLFCVLGGLAPNFNKFSTSTIVYLLQGLSITAVLLFNNAYVYMVAVFVYTGACGWASGLLGVTILDINLEADLEVAIGASWLGFGIGYFLSTPFAVFLEQSFSYEVAFGQAAAVYFLAAILSLLVYIWDSYNSCGQTLKSNQNESLLFK